MFIKTTFEANKSTFGFSLYSKKIQAFRITHMPELKPGKNKY